MSVDSGGYLPSRTAIQLHFGEYFLIVKTIRQVMVGPTGREIDHVMSWPWTLPRKSRPRRPCSWFSPGAGSTSRWSRWAFQTGPASPAPCRRPKTRGPGQFVPSYTPVVRIWEWEHSTGGESALEIVLLELLVQNCDQQRLVCTYDASISTSTSTTISHVWTGKTQAQARVPFSCACACVVRVNQP